LYTRKNTANTEDAFQRVSICPKVELLLALKCLAFGVSPSGFQDLWVVQQVENASNDFARLLLAIWISRKNTLG
jgi:hypothetical protein